MEIKKRSLNKHQPSQKWRGVYLDYAAGTPVTKDVELAMKPYMKENFGNAGSLHYFGQKSLAALDKSRETLAKILSAKFNEIIFTSGATEANNLALRGIVKGFRVQGLGFSENRDEQSPTLNPSGYTLTPRIIVSAIEHASILETAKDLEREGVDVIYLSVDKEGFIDLEELKNSLNKRTVLISIMYANNEIGVIQPIAEIAKIISEFKIKNQSAKDFLRLAERSNKFERSSLGIKNKNLLTPKPYTLYPMFYPLFHTDAVQAFQFLDTNVNNLGVDLMTLSAHKIYGPKGVGALYVANRVQGLGVRDLKRNVPNSKPHALNPITTGGEQEFGLRAGTENIPGIVGFAKAAEIAQKRKLSEAKRILKLRNYLWNKLKKSRPNIELNGPPISAEKVSLRLPNNLNIYFPGERAEDLLIKFDMAGIAASSGSACSVRSFTPSHIVTALGFNEERGKSSIRLTLGYPTTKNHIDKFLERVLKLV